MGKAEGGTPAAGPDPGDAPFLKILRPLVEAYFAFLRKSERHVRSLGLTPAQFDVIVTLGGEDPMNCRQLSLRTLVTRGTLTGVLDRLEAKGLIERVSSRDDRRCTLIRLTVQGDRLFRRVFPAHIGYLEPFFRRALTTAQMKQLRGMLLKLKASFETEE